MKRIISVFLVAAVAMGTAFAQGRKGDDGWRDRMKAEMVGFITSEVNLTSAEAEKFWPVYNEAKEKQHEAFRAAHQAYKDLAKAVEEGKTGADVKALTDAYLKAQDASNQVLKDYISKFRSILPEEKVAKLYMAEEKFRRQQISNLGHKGKGGKGTGKGKDRK